MWFIRTVTGSVWQHWWVLAPGDVEKNRSPEVKMPPVSLQNRRLVQLISEHRDMSSSLQLESTVGSGRLSKTSFQWTLTSWSALELSHSLLFAWDSKTQIDFVLWARRQDVTTLCPTPGSEVFSVRANDEMIWSDTEKERYRNWFNLDKTLGAAVFGQRSSGIQWGFHVLRWQWILWAALD